MSGASESAGGSEDGEVGSSAQAAGGGNIIGVGTAAGTDADPVANLRGKYI
jgi:hypothetical protein